MYFLLIEIHPRASRFYSKPKPKQNKNVMNSYLFVVTSYPYLFFIPYTYEGL